MKFASLILSAFLFFAAAADASHIVPAPVTTFTSSATKTTPGQATTLSWTTTGLLGVNLQISGCTDKVFITSPNYTGNLPCGGRVFSSPLGVNSSLTLNFTNSSIDDKSLNFLLLASFDGTTYDALHGSSIAVTVSTDVLPDPSVSFFNASSTEVIAGNSVPISWSALNVQGVNIKIACSSAISVATSSAKDALALPCDAYAFVNDLQKNGTQSFFFKTSNAYSESILFTLVPVLPAGGYDLTKRRTLLLNVGPPPKTPPPPSPLPLPAPTTPTPVKSPAPLPTPPPAQKLPAPAPIPTRASPSGFSPKPAPVPVELKTPPPPPSTQTEGPKVLPKRESERPVFELPARTPRPEKRLSLFQRFLNFLGNLLGLTPPPK